MLLELSINKFAAKAALALAVSCACVMLSYAIITNFIVSALTDERANVSRDTLESAARYFSDSARLNARLAEAFGRERDMADAEAYAIRAISLSPYNYNFHLLLATIKESNGEAQAAEDSLREAIRLAPNKTDAHWQLANFLLRTGKLGQATGEFRAACAMNQKLLPVTLVMIWRASGGKLEALEAVTAADVKSKLALAQFLLKQSRADAAADVFNRIERKALLASPETGEFINALAGSNYLELARKLWVHVAGDDSREYPLVWNGSFESDIVKGFAQFDWAIGSSDYAKVKISSGQSHGGSRALRVDFTGRDTTRLTGEISQLIVLNSGARYLIECYAKAETLVTTEGPRIAVTTRAGDLVAVSEPVAVAETGWQRLTIEFTAPQTPDAFYIAVKRRSKFSYDQPTTGTIWFDDFKLTEVKQSR
ncbi:MAG: carbohydrate binding domain-containing protein [Blastocatellia bacterium]